MNKKILFLFFVFFLLISFSNGMEYFLNLTAISTVGENAISVSITDDYARTSNPFDFDQLDQCTTYNDYNFCRWNIEGTTEGTFQLNPSSAPVSGENLEGIYIYNPATGGTDGYSCVFFDFPEVNLYVYNTTYINMSYDRTGSSTDSIWCLIDSDLEKIYQCHYGVVTNKDFNAQIMQVYDSNPDNTCNFPNCIHSYTTYNVESRFGNYSINNPLKVTGMFLCGGRYGISYDYFRFNDVVYTEPLTNTLPYIDDIIFNEIPCYNETTNEILTTSFFINATDDENDQIYFATSSGQIDIENILFREDFAYNFLVCNPDYTVFGDTVLTNETTLLLNPLSCSKDFGLNDHTNFCIITASDNNFCEGQLIYGETESGNEPYFIDFQQNIYYNTSLKFDLGFYHNETQLELDLLTEEFIYLFDTIINYTGGNLTYVSDGFTLLNKYVNVEELVTFDYNINTATNSIILTITNDNSLVGQIVFNSTFINQPYISDYRYLFFDSRNPSSTIAEYWGLSNITINLNDYELLLDFDTNNEVSIDFNNYGNYEVSFFVSDISHKPTEWNRRIETINIQNCKYTINDPLDEDYNTALGVVSTSMYSICDAFDNVDSTINFSFCNLILIFWIAISILLGWVVGLLIFGDVLLWGFLSSLILVIGGIRFNGVSLIRYVTWQYIVIGVLFALFLIANIVKFFTLNGSGATNE